MSTLQHLREEMAAIARAARDDRVALVLGGGLGVLLRVESKVKSGAPTLAPIPEARATTDLDLLVSAEVITDAAATKRLRRLLDQRGYRPITGAENYQFARSSESGDYKVDLLAEEPASQADVIADDRRIRPHGYRGLHAHRGREIIALTEATVEVELVPGMSVATPNLMTYSLMKMFALWDQRDSREKGYGRSHAFDLYALWASTAESEWDGALDVRSRFAGSLEDLRAGHRVADLFAESTSPGSIRLREAWRERRSTGGVDDQELSRRFREDLMTLLSP